MNAIFQPCLVVDLFQCMSLGITGLAKWWVLGEDVGMLECHSIAGNVFCVKFAKFEEGPTGTQKTLDQTI